jgi:hypothetical protein
MISPHNSQVDDGVIKPVERRKHGRFRVPKDAYVALRSDYLRFAQIEHVSMDGLDFCYVANNGPVSEPFELDIFLAGSAFYLYKVPFKTISDYEKDNDMPFPWLPVRRCGVQFGKLTPNQKNMLAYFIHNHTMREAHQQPDLH